MKFSCVLFCTLAFVSCMFVSPFKKNSSRFLFCSTFPASNLLQIFQLIPCKSLWDLTCLVSWADKCFLCDELSHTGLLPSVEPKPFGATEAHNSVPLISLQERQLATCSYILFDPDPLNDSCPLPHHIRLVVWFCDSRTKPICNKNPEEPFLEIDVKGGERDLIEA